MRKSILAALAAVFLLAAVAISPIGLCNDGWLPQSIGKQGACSWHGGVFSVDTVLS